MKKSPLIFIEHILESIGIIEKYIDQKHYQNIVDSIQLQESVTRRMEIIGEAMKNLPEEIYKKFPEIPWKKIIAMRNILIHEYFGIDLEVT